MFSDVEVQNLHFFWGGGEEGGDFSFEFDHGQCDDMSCSSSVASCANPGRTARWVFIFLTDVQARL